NMAGRRRVRLIYRARVQKSRQRPLASRGRSDNVWAAGARGTPCSGLLLWSPALGRRRDWGGPGNPVNKNRQTAHRGLVSVCSGAYKCPVPVTTLRDTMWHHTQRAVWPAALSMPLPQAPRGTPPMHIKKLEIAGFKSFVERTVIHFDHDVIGIVGPNG